MNWTLLSVPRPFENEFETIQSNALGSWIRLGPKPTIVLFGDESVAEAAGEFGCTWVSKIEYSEPNHIPVLSSVFAWAREHAESDLLCYVNADIMLHPSFVKALGFVSRGLKRFLLVGRRTNLDELRPFWFTRDWARGLTDYAEEHGSLWSRWGADYFGFRKGLFAGMPPFVVGRGHWDNWMLWHARRRRRVPVVDASRSVLALHPPHGGYGSKRETPEWVRNTTLRYGGSRSKLGNALSIRYARTHLLIYEKSPFTLVRA